MGFCSNCGKKIADDALFCSYCGARTRKGVEANVPVPTEEFRETSRIGEEMEKAFSTAAREIRKAFRTARDNIAEATTKTTTTTPAKATMIVCESCGERNQPSAVYCYSCGKKLGQES